MHCELINIHILHITFKYPSYIGKVRPTYDSLLAVAECLIAANSQDFTFDRTCRENREDAMEVN